MQEPQEMQVQSLGREDPLEEGMATHSSILAWRIPWTEEPGTVTKNHTRLKWLSTHAQEQKCMMRSGEVDTKPPKKSLWGKKEDDVKENVW